jgi:hypothetical protein
VTEVTVRKIGPCYLPVVFATTGYRRAVMSPSRNAVLVVLFALAALSAVETFVEAYNLGEGLWAWTAGHQFALEGGSSPVVNGKPMFMSR